MDDPSETKDISKKNNHSQYVVKLRAKLMEAKDEFGDDIVTRSDFWKDF